MKADFSQHNPVGKSVKPFLFKAFGALLGFDPLDNVVPTRQSFA